MAALVDRLRPAAVLGLGAGAQALFVPTAVAAPSLGVFGLFGAAP